MGLQRAVFGKVLLRVSRPIGYHLHPTIFTQRVSPQTISRNRYKNVQLELSFHLSRFSTPQSWKVPYTGSEQPMDRFRPVPAIQTHTKVKFKPISLTIPSKANKLSSCDLQQNSLPFAMHHQYTSHLQKSRSEFRWACDTRPRRRNKVSDDYPSLCLGPPQIEAEKRGKVHRTRRTSIGNVDD